MDLRDGVETSESRFASYVEAVSSGVGHADRVAPLKAYCKGLLLPGERKSVEPMAARVEPGRVQAAHQSLHHFVAKADWSDAAVLAVVQAQVLPGLERQGPIRAWIVDDTGFPKKGRHSVGVARQYCGQLGKQDNCQIAVSLSVATDHASLPIAYRLYLPEAWANDPDRRAKAGVPEEVAFRTKPEIALTEIQAALAAGVPRGVVLADAGYGIDTAFRSGVSELGLAYVLAIQSSTGLWPPGNEPLPPKAWSRRGRPPSLLRRNPQHKPVSAKQLALGPARERLAHRHLAGGHARSARLPLRRLARQAGASGLLALRTAAGGMVPGRMARGRERTDQILALHLARGHAARRLRRPGQAALAHRAGLPGAQAGDRPRSLRRPRLARLPPSRHARYRRLRLPGLRAEPDSPLGLIRRAAPPSTSPIRRLSTPRNPRFDPSGTSSTPSPPSALDWRAPWHDSCRDVLAANVTSYDTVGLGV